MKLKGKYSEKLNNCKKEIMQKTLDKMTMAREQDTVVLRDIIKNKILWIIQEKVKGENLILEHKQRIEDLSIQIYRLEGALSILNEIVKPKEEKKLNGKKY